MHVYPRSIAQMPRLGYQNRHARPLEQACYIIKTGTERYPTHVQAAQHTQPYPASPHSTIICTATEWRVRNRAHQGLHGRMVAADCDPAPPDMVRTHLTPSWAHPSTIRKPVPPGTTVGSRCKPDRRRPCTTQEDGACGHARLPASACAQHAEVPHTLRCALMRTAIK